MPYITVESGALSDEQKEELIKRLTEISSEIMQVPQEFFVTTIKEVSDKNFGIGGKTIDKVKKGIHGETTITFNLSGWKIRSHGDNT